MLSENIISIHFQDIKPRQFEQLEKFEDESTFYAENSHLFYLNNNVLGDIISYKNYSLDYKHQNLEMEISFPEMEKQNRKELIINIHDVIQKKYNLPCYFYLGRKNSLSNPYDFCV